MNVLVLCLSHGYGGLELYVYREIKYFQQLGVSCLPVISEGSMLEKKLKQDGIDYKILKSRNKNVPVFSAQKLARIILRNNIDILHISWGKDLNLASLAKYFSGNQLRLVYSRHMEITRSKKDLFHRWFYRKVDKLLAVSTLVEENARAFLPLENHKIERLYLGVASPGKTNTECKPFFEQQKIQQRKLNIALFGRVEKGKAQHIMLSALKLLIDGNYDVSLTIIGHVMDEHYYSKLVESMNLFGIKKYVNFTGMVENAINIMPCFDVVVLTTPKETFGLVLVEAMRSGVAVVGTNAGGVLDIIDHKINGLLFEPNNAESLYETLCSLYINPEMKQNIALQGKKKADALFSDEQHFNKLNNIFTSLTDSA